MSLSTIAGTSAPPVNEVGTQDTSEITPRQEFVGHTYWVTGAIHLPCGQRMMTCSLDGSLRVWNLKTGKQIGEDWRDGDRQEGDWRNGESGVWTIALSPDGEKVVSGSWDGGVRLWDTNKGKVIAKWVGHKKDVISVCWSRDGQRVLSGSFDGTAREWDVENGETVLGPIETGHKEVYAVIYSPDMTMFATAGYNERTLPPESPLKIWDSKTGELIITLRGHTDPMITPLGHGILPPGPRSQCCKGTPILSMPSRFLRIIASSQVHRQTTQLDYGTSTTASPSACPSVVTVTVQVQ